MNDVYRHMLLLGDCLEKLKEFEDESIDACITDPPYGMGMDVWDKNVPPIELWREVYRVLKPGSFCLSFCSPELYHRMAVNVEDAGFLIKDQIMWMVTTKMVKKNRLKPAHEPIVVAQKPLVGSIENNQNQYGVGQINIDDVRVPWDGKPPTGWVGNQHQRRKFGREKTSVTGEEKRIDANPNGRYPSNIVGEVLPEHQKYFYAPRATRREKGESNNHPTVKPVSLMEWLVKIYSHPDNVVLDPFMGSGTTGVACMNLSREFIGIDQCEDYYKIAEERMNFGRLPMW